MRRWVTFQLHIVTVRLYKNHPIQVHFYRISSVGISGVVQSHFECIQTIKRNVNAIE